jgi:hypothetical protein
VAGEYDEPLCWFIYPLIQVIAVFITGDFIQLYKAGDKQILTLNQLQVYNKQHTKRRIA